MADKEVIAWILFTTTTAEDYRNRAEHSLLIRASLSLSFPSFSATLSVHNAADTQSLDDGQQANSECRHIDRHGMAHRTDSPVSAAITVTHAHTHTYVGEERTNKTCHCIAVPSLVSCLFTSVRKRHTNTYAVFPVLLLPSPGKFRQQNRERNTQ